MEKKELEPSNSGSKGKKEIKVVPLNLKETQKVKRKRPVRSIKNSVNTKEKSLKTEKTLKPNKEKQTRKGKYPDNTK